MAAASRAAGAFVLALGCAQERPTIIPEPPATFALDAALAPIEPNTREGFERWNATFPGCPHALGQPEPLAPGALDAVVFGPELTGDYVASWSYLRTSLSLGQLAFELPDERVMASVLHELGHARGVKHLDDGLMADELPYDQPAVFDDLAYGAVCDAAPLCCREDP